MTTNSLRISEGSLTDWTALLPPAPWATRAKLPSLLVNRRHTWKMRVQINRMHLAGIVALHGKIPKDVMVQHVSFQRGPDMPDEPRLMATQCHRNEQSRNWLEAFQHGLEAWDEAGFDDPVDAVPHIEGEIEGYVFSVANYDQFLINAFRGLAVARRTRELENLRGHHF